LPERKTGEARKFSKTQRCSRNREAPHRKPFSLFFAFKGLTATNKQDPYVTLPPSVVTLASSYEEKQKMAECKIWWSRYYSLHPSVYTVTLTRSESQYKHSWTYVTFQLLAACVCQELYAEQRPVEISTGVLSVRYQQWKPIRLQKALCVN
jgi:hypothetical protein